MDKICPIDRANLLQVAVESPRAAVHFTEEFLGRGRVGYVPNDWDGSVIECSYVRRKLDPVEEA